MSWFCDRLKEPSTWGGIAAFFAAAGLALVGANTNDPSVWIAAIGAGAAGVVAFLRKEQGGQ
jgi:hypothetical protein